MNKKKTMIQLKTNVVNQRTEVLIVRQNIWDIYEELKDKSNFILLNLVEDKEQHIEENQGIIIDKKLISMVSYIECATPEEDKADEKVKD